MLENPKVALLTMEAGIRLFWGDYQRANYRGGLGLLMYDFIGCMAAVFRDINARVFVPLHSIPWHQPNIKLAYRDVLGEPDATLPILLGGGEREPWYINQWNKVIDHQSVTLLEFPDKHNVASLYTEVRLARLRQQILLPRAVEMVMERENFKPDVVWLNECATGLLVPMLRENAAFPNPKVLYTNHTTLGSAREIYRDYRWNEVGIGDAYRDVFVEHEVLDLMRGLMQMADVVNGVSREHEQVLKEMFPQYREKVTHVTNGVNPAYWMSRDLRERVLAGREITGKELLELHETQRGKFFDMIYSRTGTQFKMDRFTVGFNRRFQGYKQNAWPRLYVAATTAEYGRKVKTELGELEGLGGQFAAAGMAPETDIGMLEEIIRYKAACRPNPHAAFIEESSIPLMEHFARGLDLHLSMAELRGEAAGTSPDRNAQEGIPTVATWTGSIPEWMRHFEWQQGAGNGFVISPDCTTPQEQYYQVKYFAMIWYRARQGNAQAQKALEDLAKNVFDAGKGRDASVSLEGYRSIIHTLCPNRK